MATPPKRILIFVCLSSLFITFSCSPTDPLTKSIPQWDTLELTFEGPQTSEDAESNPFLDMRLDVEFTHHTGTIYTIPGFYAADGNAAETGAGSGNIWKVRFSPDRVGEWTWEAHFTTGKNVAVNGNGNTIAISPSEGTFIVSQGKENESTFKKQGRLTVDGTYYRFAGSNKYWLKAGADSPENFLAYADFDGTYRYQAQTEGGESKTDTILHHYQPHVSDWKEGDPTWQGAKGKGIIGALNYLASQHMNSVYFLTMNIEGDGKDVWPYTSHEERHRFDCSKLDQWDIVFSHMEDLGIMMHVVIQETENETLLDKGNTELERKLYFRELIARFGHHLALTWNLGEENGPANFSPNGQTTAQREAMIDYFASNDPYDHPVVLHTHAWAEAKDHILDSLLGYKGLDGLSMQISQSKNVHSEFLRWKSLSAESSHPWLLGMDEIGQWYKGALPDEVDPSHDTLRREVLWGSLLAGGAGIEWYFGAKYAHNDLQCEDWRSREKLWDQSHIAVDFFDKYLPYWEMLPLKQGERESPLYGMAKEEDTYVLYMESANVAQLPIDLPSGTYSLQWYDPRNGGALQEGSIETLEGGNNSEIGIAPSHPERDWVILIQKHPE